MASKEFQTSVWKAAFMVFAIIPLTAVCLDNGLGLTPPMGWNSWLTLGCNRNCTANPNSCLNEANLRQMADRMAADGFLAAGYEFLGIDDCWPAPQRGSDGRLVADPQRFPSGIRALADYVHGKGLKLGIYTDIGLRTCAGFPGSELFLELDAQTFAEWGVDYVKVDGCNVDADDIAPAYKALSLFLNRTGRPMFYMCQWPAYQLGDLMQPNYTAIQNSCNSWRNFLDMKPYWNRVLQISCWWGVDLFNSSKFARPGAWNDPDLLVVGMNALTADQEAVQMSLWAVMAAPLMMGADLRNVSELSRQLLLHPGVLRINQDPLGVQGTMVKAVEMRQYWRRPLHPAPSTFALAILNLDPVAGLSLNACVADFGLSPGAHTVITDVLANRTVCSNCSCAPVALRPFSVSLWTVRV